MTNTDDKAARLAAALRANLARRKAQKRARAEAETGETKAEPDAAKLGRPTPDDGE